MHVPLKIIFNINLWVNGSHHCGKQQGRTIYTEGLDSLLVCQVQQLQSSKSDPRSVQALHAYTKLYIGAKRVKLLPQSLANYPLETAGSHKELTVISSSLECHSYCHSSYSSASRVSRPWLVQIPGKTTLPARFQSGPLYRRWSLQ